MKIQQSMKVGKSKPLTAASKGCLTLFMMPFLLTGFGVIAAGLVGIINGSKTLGAGLVMVAFGSVFAGVAVMFLYVIHIASRRAVTLTKAGGAELLDWRTNPIFPNRKGALPRGINGGVLLPVDASVRTGAMVLLVFSLIWMGVVGSILLFSSRGKSGDTIGTVMLSLFLLIGVALFIGAIYMFYKAATVGDAVCEVGEEPLVPGGGTWVNVRLPKALPVNRVELSLLCREVVQYRRGTDTITHTEIVLRKGLGSASNVRGGATTPLLEARVELPANAMHSFKSPNNQVVWTLQVTMDIPGRPDIKNDFTILVAPGNKV